METNESIDPRSDAAGVDRRMLLKGAVAAGVGVAAWTAPSITSLGGTPVYAANCTGPVIPYFLGERNTSCDCSNGTNDTVSLKWPYTDDCGETNVYYTTYPKNQNSMETAGDTQGPRNITFNFGNNGSCPVGSETKSGQVVGDAAVTISAPLPAPAGPGPKYCVIEVLVYSGNSCGLGTLRGSATTGIVGTTAKTLDMPSVTCGSSTDPWPSNLFMRLNLKCSDDDACLTTAY